MTDAVRTTPRKMAAAPVVKRRLAGRDRLEADIVAIAVRVFADCGYEGASIASVAAQAGLSKQNLMYYFPTKQALYQRVLDDVLDDWLARMDQLADQPDPAAQPAAHLAAQPPAHPANLLRAYIHAKLRFSREQPWASRVYALEVINGAPLYGEQIRRRVVPLVHKDIAVFERWIADGRIAAVNATHLLFAIWAMTQSYADFAAQMALVLERTLGESDFVDAENMIVDMVMRAVALPPATLQGAPHV